MTYEDSCLIIESVCDDGRRFRPSDWIERIAAAVGRFGPDHRLTYTQAVRPAIIDGDKCLVVDKCLRQDNRQLYDFILNFATSNRLRVRAAETATS